MPHTINGVRFGGSTEPVKKIGDIPELVPHVYKSLNPKQYIVTIVNEDIDENYRVYMPVYITERGLPEKSFIYCGLEK